MGKLRMTSTSPKPRGKGQSASVSEPPNQSRVMARQGRQNVEVVVTRTPTIGEPEKSSHSLVLVQPDLQRVKSSKGGVREVVKPFTQFRRNRIRTFNNDNCLHPGQPLFGKIGSPIWIDRFIKYLASSSRAKVKASDVLSWLENFNYFFVMEQERLRDGRLPGPSAPVTPPETSTDPGTSASTGSSGSTKAVPPDATNSGEGDAAPASNSGSEQDTDLHPPVDEPEPESYEYNSDGEFRKVATPGAFYYDPMTPSFGVFGMAPVQPRAEEELEQENRGGDRDPCLSPYEPIGDLLTFPESEELQEIADGGFNFLPLPILDLGDFDFVTGLASPNGTGDQGGVKQMEEGDLATSEVKGPGAEGRSPPEVVGFSLGLSVPKTVVAPINTPQSILAMADNELFPATRENLDVFTTVLIKLIDKAKRDGTCLEMNMDVCYHIMQGMRACIDGAGKV